MELPDFRSLVKKPPSAFAVLLGTLFVFLAANWLLRDNPALSFVPTLIAALIAVEFFVFVALEVREGTQKHGWKHEAVDTLVALAVAVAAWYGASFLLNTSTPLSAVVSCSMLPNLQRGDFVVVQGTPVAAYSLNMTPDELASLSSRAVVSYAGKEMSIDGSLYPYCLTHRDEACSAFKSAPETVVETKGAFTYRYMACPLALSNGTTLHSPCLRSVEFRGTEYPANFSHDIIVYQPPKGDLYAAIGDIVHRVVFRVSSGGRDYYMTRGDNNPVLDIQVYDYGSGRTNHPVPQENLRGRVIGRIPFLGYFKLFISNFLQEDGQCRKQLSFDHV